MSEDTSSSRAVVKQYLDNEQLDDLAGCTLKLGSYEVYVVVKVRPVHGAISIGGEGIGGLAKEARYAGIATRLSEAVGQLPRIKAAPVVLVQQSEHGVHGVVGAHEAQLLGQVPLRIDEIQFGLAPYSVELEEGSGVSPGLSDG